MDTGRSIAHRCLLVATWVGSVIGWTVIFIVLVPILIVSIILDELGVGR